MQICNKIAQGDLLMEVQDKMTSSKLHSTYPAYQAPYQLEINNILHQHYPTQGSHRAQAYSHWTMEN